MLNPPSGRGRLRFLRRATDPPRQRFRRGVYILPSLLTMGNMFCGYACVVYSMRGDIETAAPFIGLSVVLDMLDGRVARMTRSESAFGLQFDSLADVISFGMAPAILSFQWGLSQLGQLGVAAGRLGWAAGFLFVACAAMRLARFNIQSGGDKRYFVGMPSPAAAAIPASTVYAYPEKLTDPVVAVFALAVVVIPALLMVSTIRFRSFKTFDSPNRRPYTVLLLLALFLILVVTHPRFALVAIAYSYLSSAFIGMLITRFKHRGGHPAAEAPEHHDAEETVPRDSAAR